MAATRLGRAAVFAGATIVGTMTAGCWTGANKQTTPIEERRVETPPLMAPPPGTIRGVVRNGANGEPLAGQSLTIQLPDGNQLYATSNPQGVYEFSKLPPGPYTIEYRSGHPRQGPQSVEVTLGAETGALADVTVFFPAPDRGPCCKPYGAPPARRRIV